MKKENCNPDGNQLPKKKKFRIPYQNLIVGAAAFAYFFTLQTNQVLATDMWTKAETIMKDVYGKILGISTIAAIVTASVALLLMNFSKSGNEKLAKELLERQAEILTSLYGDGLELSDEELESSMNTSGQSEPEAEGGENSSTKPDDSHDKEPEETSGEE